MVTELPENRKMSRKVSNERNKQTTLLIPLTVHQLLRSCQSLF
jgi:hypothetical protein